MTPYNIGIVGCGVGGLASAINLTRQGHTVDIFDKFETPSPIGSGLVIQPVGQAVLKDLGCLEAVLAKSAPIYTMHGTESSSGISVLHVDYGPENGDVFGLGIHRGTLFQILFDHLQTLRVNLIPSSHITKSSVNAQGRHVETQTQTHGPYDLIIDASGAHSPLSPIKTRPLTFGALWGTVDWVDSSPLPKNRLTQCYRGASKMMGVLPLGTLPNDDTPKAAVFWSEPRETLPAWPSSGLEAWKDEAIGLWSEFAPFISQITQADQMTPATYDHGTLRQPYQDRLAIIGDAAHQASPQLGQGANMALLDAKVLCKALESHNIDKALKLYARRRFAHVRLYQIFSSVFTPFYQSNSAILPPVRNYVFNPLSRIWPVRTMLTRLVCGTLIKP
ncbi:MAG: NAD(P)/FAD-dependent oxidoreductase [Maricaulaceae bacterium]